MRIISGHLKGRTFSVPSSFPSRPTTDFAKEGLFNVLNNLIEFEGLTLLDLCVGTGNLSFEFISRGATSVTCVDKSPKVAAWLKKNADLLDVSAKLSIHTQDCISFLQRTTMQYDIIIADPPFELKFHKDIVQVVKDRKLLKPGGYLIVEHGRQTDLSTETNFINTRTFGNVNFSFFQ